MKKTCEGCKGTGRCQNCKGTGRFGYPGFGPPDSFTGKCGFCQGSGVCAPCQGNGQR